MEDLIKNAISDEVAKFGFTVFSVKYSKGTLEIILDTDQKVDIDLITKATKAISPILDKGDFIKEGYILDVSSKEKEEI